MINKVIPTIARRLRLLERRCSRRHTIFGVLLLFVSLRLFLDHATGVTGGNATRQL
jgi:hypothetical protein